MIKFYSYYAGKGECIRIQYGEGHNILVDSGVICFGSKYLEICKEIQDCGETLDLLVFTHEDEDHIGGALYVTRMGKALNAKEVWMNSEDEAWRRIMNVPLSKRQNQELYSNLLARGLVVNSAFKGMIRDVGGAILTVLWPTKDIVKQCEDLNRNIQLSRISDYGESLSDLVLAPLRRKDSSLTNRTSIVFEFTYCQAAN